MCVLLLAAVGVGEPVIDGEGVVVKQTVAVAEGVVVKQIVSVAEGVVVKLAEGVCVCVEDGVEELDGV